MYNKIPDNHNVKYIIFYLFLIPFVITLLQMRSVEKKLKKTEARKEKKKSASLAIKTSKITGRVPSMKKLKKMVISTAGGKATLEKLKMTRREKRMKMKAKLAQSQTKAEEVLTKSEEVQVETEKVPEVEMEVEDNKA